ncbi:MAG: sigma 54-interacting transcriptional regulator [Deltaproteobacteria bacterium]|nr:sigma 54-interacting transcriptional regulator [Deltaproteobacteria bacterium]
MTTPPDKILPAELAGGRYEVRAFLGAGAQASVYRAFDRLHGREVVVKALAPGVEDAAAREHDALARLSHPNLVELVDVLEVEGRPLLVETFAPGPDFCAWAAETPGPARMALGAAAALRGLEALHLAGAVHRDLKPDALRVGPGTIGLLPAVRLLDFGLCSFAPVAETVGTLGFASPETLAGDPATAASDLYSLGAVLHAACFGRPPGGLGDDDAATVPAYPAAPALRELVVDLLRTRPSARPGAAAVRAALSEVAGRSLELTVEELAGDYFPAAPLVGREAELRRLAQALEEARRGAASGLQLFGAGATTLARWACGRARLLGLEVLVPSGPESLLVSRGGGAPAPERLVTDAVDVLLARAAQRPLVVCLAGWSFDEPVAAAFLGQLARSLGLPGARGCLLLCCGEIPAGQAGAMEPFWLRPLEAEEVLRAARYMLAGRRDPAWLEQLPDRSGGDPRRVVELVRAQVEAGLPERLVGGESLELLTERRFRALGPHERRSLGVLALPGRPVPAGVLLRLESLGGAALQALFRRGAALPAGDGAWRPADPELGERASLALDESTRRAAHRRFLLAWREEGTGDALALARHLLGLGDPRRAAELLLESPAVPSRELAAVAAALDPADELRARLEERQARAARAGGRLEEGLALARALALRAPKAGALLEAELLLDAGQPRPALAALEGVGERGAAGAVLAARAAFLLGEHARATAEAEAGLLEASADERTQLLLENLVGLACVYTGEVARGEARLRAALARARELALRDAEPLTRLLNSMGIALQRQGRLEEAAEVYREGLEQARALGDLRFAASSALNLGTISERLLAFGEALQAYTRAALLARRAGALTTAATAAANEGNLRLGLGDLSGAEAKLDEAVALAETVGGGATLGHALLYRAELRLARGERARAEGELRRARASGADGDAALAFAATLLEGELELRGRRSQRARELGQTLVARVQVEDPDAWRAHLLLGRAQLALAERPSDAAIQQLELALAAARPHAGERRFEVHAELARAFAARAEELTARFHAGEATRLLDGLRDRVPPELRELFDRRDEVRGARAVAAELPPLAPSDAGPTPAQLLRLLELNTELNQRLSLEQLLTRILDCAIELTGAERGFVLLGDPDRLRVAAGRNVDQEALRSGVKKFSRTIARLAMTEGRPVVAADAMEDERLGQQLSIHGLKLRAVLCVPLRAGREARGALYVDNRFRPRAFDQVHVTLVEAFAEQAGIALETARLLEDSARHRELLGQAKAELETLNQRLEAQVVQQAQELSEISVRLRSQEEELVRRFNAAKLVGRSKVMRELFLQIDRVAQADVPVLIWGESGTGKELVARAIHYTSPRKAHPFVSLNCGAIPPTLLESELFGHSRGAFTGALRDRPGLFEVAGRGTLFLDEVGDMPAEMQVKLLRILQEGAFRRVGEEHERKSHCRVLSASLHRLEELVAKGRFREDLYYRLNVVQLAVPALRERREDIPLLVDHILAGLPRKVKVSPRALAALVDFDWPGNVRQLENELQRSALLADETIEVGSLSPALRRADPGPSKGGASRAAGLADALRGHERQLIQQALRETNYHVTEAAERLGLHRVVLHRKMRALGIRRPGRRVQPGSPE